ncbi:hypothetical protein CN13_09500, partial [Petrotoga sp. HKA.pet.4.5]
FIIAPFHPAPHPSKEGPAVPNPPGGGLRPGTHFKIKILFLKKDELFSTLCLVFISAPFARSPP